MNLICFRHPDYKGASSPVLSCKTCCGLFLTELKRRNAAGNPMDTTKWLAEKTKMAEDAIKEANRQEAAAKNSQVRFGFNPTTI